jgi:hypothetical protein
MAINAVIGDEGFVRAFGRAPAPGDPAQTRIQCHLALVEERLRLRGVRARVRERLRAYRAAGRFPRGESPVRSQPTWIDARGVRCAVAHLAEADLGEGAIRALDAAYHNALVCTFRSPILDAWAASQGMTREDLAWIQPEYDPEPPLANVDVDVAAEYRHAIAHDEADGTAPRVGYVTTRLRYHHEPNHYIGTPLIGIDGAIGPSSHGLAYDAHLRTGTEVTLNHRGYGEGHRVGGTVGFGLDAVGTRIERAWTIPLDVYASFVTSRSTRFGLVAGPRFAVVGDRDIGGRIGVDLALRDVWSSKHPLAARDIHLRAGAEQMAAVTFIGISLSIATRGRLPAETRHPEG